MPTTTLPTENLQKTDFNSRSPSAFSRVVKFSIEFVISMCIVLGLLELIFSVAGVGEQEVLQIDKSQGYSPFTNKAVCWRREGFSRTVFNSWGIPGTGRETLLQKPGKTYRIALMGDSYVEALQVNPNKTAAMLLENGLNKQVDRKKDFEVLNFGVQSHNLGQTYLRLKEFAINFKPDLVILAIKTDATYLLPPDTSHGFLGARPNFFLSAGKLMEDRTIQDLWAQSREARRMQNTHWLRKNCRLWGLLGQCMELKETWIRENSLFSGFTRKRKVTIANSTPVRNSEVANNAVAFWWTVADALIRDMNEVCTRNGSAFLVVRLPGKAGETNKIENEFLEKTVNTYDLDYLDLTDEFQLLRRTDSEPLFYDLHLSEKGNQVLSEHLLTRVSKKFNH